ncbi:MAG: FAD-dependent oxidoreductase [Omnitrophica bacterium]|nr:FAD-dependent oxidoreductase [Candidatus Omnitrophota bacterium]
MKYVIIGGSAAGVNCAEVLRKNDKAAEITLISDESFSLYSRSLLTYLIAGSIDEGKLYFKDESFYKDNKIKVYLGKKAVSIDARKKTITLEDKTEVSYDKLLLATGAEPKSVDIPGVDKQGVFTLRKIDDARKIIALLDRVKEIVVLGGGLIGLRDACALRQRAKAVTVVVKSPQVLSQMVDVGAARMISTVLEQNGIKIMTGVAAKEVLGGNSAEGILLDNGQKLNCQMVIVGKGVKANTELALSSGLKVEEGIVVDEFLRTSDKDIFSAGDCAQTFDLARGEKRINALWPCAVEQGQIAALNMLGKKVTYIGSLSMNSVDFFGLGSISIGITKPKNEKDYEIISKEVTGKSYKKFVLKEQRIVGVVLVGDINAAGVVGPLIKKRIDISSIKHLLLKDSFNYATVIPLVAKYRECFKQQEYKDTIISYKL